MISTEKLPQFLQATQSVKRKPQQYNPQGYHQALQEGAPNTTPAILRKPSADDMEKALAYLETGRVSGSLSHQAVKQTQVNPKGKAWEGFYTPENNGTGQLSPVVSDREDSIESCPWEAYYA